MLGENPVSIGDGNKELSMILRRKELKITGFSGCNRFSGQFKSQQSKLSFYALISTNMMCIKNMDQEQHFLKALSGTKNYKIVCENLTLYNVNNKPVARFEARYMQ